MSSKGAISIISLTELGHGFINAAVVQAVADAVWLVINGLFIDQEERVCHAVVEGRVKGEEPSRQVRQASEFWLKQVKQVDLI